MQINRPRLVLAALRGSAGKTTLAVSLAAALRERGYRVFPFKKGPDYIDAAWISLAASHCCRNLDTFMMGRERVVRSFVTCSHEDAVALVEGNRGLYDGVNTKGEHSTAELAKLLAAPVVLVIDCDKVTRTMAAMVLGCMHLDPTVDIRGVILNRVGGARHATIVRRAVEESCGITVLGTVPRFADLPFAERHLGLIPPQESRHSQLILKQAAAIAEEHLDIEGLIRVANEAPPWTETVLPLTQPRALFNGVKIGVIKDEAFQFYYPENLEALTERGARIIWIDALCDARLPDVDTLYIGGGFPEVHAGQLSRNGGFLHSLRQMAEQGLPIYAECGGLIYLGECLEYGGRCFPMAGILQVRFTIEKRPQGHGYTEVEVDRENPFFSIGTKLRGHEFHYCRVISSGDDIERHTVFHVKRGRGIDGQRDGYCRKNILASFTHLHALGAPQWAEGLIARAERYRLEKSVPLMEAPAGGWD